MMRRKEERQLSAKAQTQQSGELVVGSRVIAKS